MTPCFNAGCLFLCYKVGVKAEGCGYHYPCTPPFLLLANLKDRENFMFKDKDILEVLINVDRKLANLITMYKNQIIKNQSKGDK